MTKALRRLTSPALVVLLCTWLAACSGGLFGSAGEGSDNPDNGLLQQGDVPLAYAKRAASLALNAADPTAFAPGGDLILRERSSPDAPEHNLTGHITQGQGDVMGLTASFDGLKLAFAMRCPSSNAAQINTAAGLVAACTGRWNLWEYDMTGLASGQRSAGSLRRLTGAADADDIDPAYLPNNRGFVFSSNRQAQTRQASPLGRGYVSLDTLGREPTLNLHTINAFGFVLTQIGFGAGHERHPVVTTDGQVLFSRLDAASDGPRQVLYRIRPDGTALAPAFGAHSPGAGLSRPREASPNGRYAGLWLANLAPLARKQMGGAPHWVDASRYSDVNTPLLVSTPASGGLLPASNASLAQDAGFSLYGRATSATPLWDGTDRVLLAWHACQVTRDGVLTPCASLSQAERTRLADPNRSVAERAADSLKDDVPAAYAIYLFDPNAQSWQILAAPAAGFMHTDPVALLARPEPAALPNAALDLFGSAAGLGLLDLRSVYDTDGLGRMGQAMLVAADLAPGCATGIATIANTELSDPRSQVPDIASLANPADPAYRCSPVRFVRVLRSVPTPAGVLASRRAEGELQNPALQIVGYAPVEPDGSLKLRLPANTPLSIQVLDAQGRAFATHSGSFQVRAGERVSCNGCHSPAGQRALNSGAVATALRTPAALNPVWTADRQDGETLAAVRARVQPARQDLGASPVYVDDWANVGRPGVVVRPSISLLYSGNPSPADDLATLAPSNGVILYADHIQPLWHRPRGVGGANTCTNCHNASSSRLDLRGVAGADGRVQSYGQLVTGAVQRDAAGQVLTRVVEGVPQALRAPALVETSPSAANFAGGARKSRLTEILWGQSLLAGAAARTAHPNPPTGTVNHAAMLGSAEKRLLAEWMDIGAPYNSAPVFAGVTLRGNAGLSLASFEATVAPVLVAQCIACHSPGQAFERNRFTITGHTAGDWQASLAFITDTCNPANNPLLALPATRPHPSGAAAGAALPLAQGSVAYQSVAAWVARGCGVN